MNSHPTGRTTKSCAFCGIPFESWAYKMRTYCSKACTAASKIGRPLPEGVVTGKRPDPANMAPFRCEICGAAFTSRHDRPRRFCSTGCRAIGKRGVPTKVPNRVEKIRAACPVCGKGFSFYSGWPRLFCGMKCYAKSRLLGFVPYYGPDWPSACKVARKRDGVCQRCGIGPKANGRALDVHHIVPFRLFGLSRCDEANAMGNLIAFCRSCHGIVEWSETRRRRMP